MKGEKFWNNGTKSNRNFNKKVEIKIEKIGIQMLTKYNLSFSQFKILLIIYKYPDKNFRQTDIEKFFYMTNPTVTGILNNLEKNDWIKRVKNPEDARSKIIQLTEKTKKIGDELIEISKKIEKLLNQNLNMEEEKILKNLLNKIIEE